MREAALATALASALALAPAIGAARAESLPQAPVSAAMEKAAAEALAAANGNIGRADLKDLEALAQKWRQDLQTRLQNPEAFGMGLEKAAPQAPPAIGADGRYTILVSWSLKEEALKEILAEAAPLGNAQVAFRGVREGETIAAAARAVNALIEAARKEARFQGTPNVLIDPRPFRRYGATVVPVIVAERADGATLTARGTTSIQAFERAAERRRAEIEAEGLRDLGQLGPTTEIEEADLIHVMQSRAAAVDWPAKKRNQIETFWRDAAFVALPEAEKERTRRIDAAVAVTRDLTGPDGRVIARAGERVNPLQNRPFDIRLIAFDASKPAQIAVAERVAAQSGKRPVYAITGLDRDGGWQALKDLENRLRGPAYLLPPELKDRFRLERVPAVVDADATHFIVTEIPPTPEK